MSMISAIISAIIFITFLNFLLLFLSSTLLMNRHKHRWQRYTASPASLHPWFAHRLFGDFQSRVHLFKERL